MYELVFITIKFILDSNNRFLNLETFKIVESIQVEFFEDKFRDDHVPIDVGPTETERNDLTVGVNVNKSVYEKAFEPRRSQRTSIKKCLDIDFIYEVILLEGDQNYIKVQTPYYVFNVQHEVPNTYEEAMASRDDGFWKEVIND
ncbi:hypothetical protein LIER_14576 [Lithospermum erythrorhizon]|uniref:Uncharacterized protein n=1 Tax=Lithospermum erythrorhizon TaxID=34254 RepID=A0AAV3Q1L1_LITER